MLQRMEGHEMAGQHNRPVVGSATELAPAVPVLQRIRVSRQGVMCTHIEFITLISLKAPEALGRARTERLGARLPSADSLPRSVASAPAASALRRMFLFLGSDSQGRFRGEFLSDAFPLILPCRPPNEIRVAWRDIVGFDAETGVGHLVN